MWFVFFFFQAEDGIRDFHVTGVQTCALPICIPIGVRAGVADRRGLVIRVVDAGAGGAVLVADGARADASVPVAVGGEDGEVLPAGELVGAAGRAIGAAGGIVAKVLAGVVQGRTQRRTVAAAGAEQAAEPGIARAALENAVVAVFDRDVVVAAVPDGPV